MVQSFVQSLRAELESAPPVALAVALLALYVLLDLSVTALVVIPAVIAAMAVLRAGLAAIDAPAYVSGLVVGGCVAVVSAAAAAFVEFSWLFVAFAAIGAWLCLDALYDRRYGTGSDRSERSAPRDDPLADLSFREHMQVTSETRVVVETLRESPVALTAAQIAERTEFSSDDVEAHLEMLGEGSPIERVGDDRYTVDEDQMGASSAARDVVRRLLRPFSVLVSGR